MDLESYESLVRSEAAARRYLLKFCWVNHQRFCPRCRHRKVYKLRSGRRRCSRCGYTFHDFSRRFINTGGLSSRQWLRLIKLFELDVSLSKCAEQLSVSYNTAFKAMNALRRSILANALDGRQLVEAGWDQEPARGEDQDLPPSRVPVFGILERGGWVFIDYLPDLSAEHILHFKLNFYLKTSSFGSVIYTESYRHYGALIFSTRSLSNVDWSRGRNETLSIDGFRGFWDYGKKRLKSYKGVTPKRFPLYLKELEFRYNHRNDDIFDLLSRFLCSFVPEREADSLF